jgi:tRNA(Ile)-lysidine synthase
MKLTSAQSFESRLLNGFALCGFPLGDTILEEHSSVLNGTAIIAAVSGGADSIALLTALTRFFPVKEKKIPVIALTIDHGIRPAEESEGDALFVEMYCKKLGVKCNTVRFERGKVKALNSERGMGIEEAARFLRYQAYESAL